MRATFFVSLGLGLLLVGCQDLEQCKDPGVVEACICGPDDTGERTCKPELVWSACDCGPDASATGGTGGMTGGMGGMTGGMGGTTGGMGGMTGGMGGTTGGMGGMTGGMGGMTGGMGGMTGGMGGSDGGVLPDAGPDGGGTEGPPYAACTMASVATDCQAGSTCESSDDVLGTVLNVCAPQCAMPADCPDPGDAAYTGDIECVSGHCRLRCSFPLVGCPEGMACAPQNDGADEFCFDDGA